MRKDVFRDLKTPCYIVDEGLVLKNLKILKSIIDRTGCKILLAQKGFSMFSMYGLIGEYLNGTTASSLFEAKLGREYMKGEVHIFSPAYNPHEFDEIMSICDHIVFNTFNQWNKYKDKVLNFDKKISCGIRINPQYSEIETDIYNPCAKNSRLGTTFANFRPELIKNIEGIHFHTLCEQNSDVLKRTIDIVDDKFGEYLRKMSWINFGGGHHITRNDYDIETLVECILYIKNKYNTEVYLEPGEAVVLNAGFLVSRVLDIAKNEMDIAILDTSAACHMPDVLEMPYRPQIIDAGMPGEKKFTYRLGGPTCLAGDIIGDYSFEKPLNIDDELVFCDMAHYTMVKNNTFNGINLPSIYILKGNGEVKLIKHFGYDDFKNRLS